MGDYRNWQSFTRRWKLKPGEFERFRDALITLRPAANRVLEKEGCSAFTPDDGGIRVEWNGGGPAVWLAFEYGCPDPDRLLIAQQLEAAPSFIGIVRDAKNWSVLRRLPRKLRQDPVAPTSAP